MLLVSDPQPGYAVTDLTVRGYVKYLRDKGADPHAFATAYVARTEELGYPPNLADCANQFLNEYQG